MHVHRNFLRQDGVHGGFDRRSQAARIKRFNDMFRTAFTSRAVAFDRLP
jgi:hypothetical protein